MKKLISAVMLCIVFTSAFAHQPRLMLNSESSIDDPYIIKDPEISKAYYAELKGRPDYYIISADKDFSLHVNILVPHINGARNDFKVEIQDDGGSFLFSLKDIDEWTLFFEPFAGDEYLRGPELAKELSPGSYYIKVFNGENLGKYSLAVGDIESFPLLEIAKTIVILPKLKSDFFNKSVLTAYWNITGLVIIISLALIAGVFLLIRLIVKKYHVLK